MPKKPLDFKKKEEKRRKDEDLFKVVDSAIDTATYNSLMLVSKKLNLEEIFGSISSGKEAKIYPAKDFKGKFYALKVFYVSTAQSKKALIKYSKGDYRFEGAKVGSTRSLVELWTKKEFRNLRDMFDAGVRVPESYIFFRNILVMDFIGENGVRAPLLKELPDDEINEDVYMDILEQITKMVKKARLVHGDLSEYNILVKDKKPYIIDVSQALPIEHDKSLELLKNDVENINRFFANKGIEVQGTDSFLSNLLGDLDVHNCGGSEDTGSKQDNPETGRDDQL
jgi:RIO kinase 1